jgi:predicted hydrocarbon binding protein
MDRKEFFKNTCSIGICSCIGIIPLNALSDTDKKPLPDWKEGFVKYRFAKLIGILDSTLDENTRNHIIENLGRECAKDGFSTKYINDLEGFFKEINTRWGEIASYDKENGIIRIETPERDCVCPFVDSKTISPSVCQCSVGWQAQTYETIFGKKVSAKCVESVVRGSKKCVFEIVIPK